MPVSHLGLTVSHIPSATSFYLAALQPLGYRFIGHQGRSIGLGVDSADFFLTQSPIGTRPSPNHIAFLADDRNVVRHCYTAALNAGANPSGAPNYRNDDCSCFNAAVEDHDGNTVEFIFRQPHGEGQGCGAPAAAPSEAGSRVLSWQKDVADSGAPDDDAASVADSVASGGSQASKASKAKSRMTTALDLAKSVKAESVRAESVKAPSAHPGIARTKTVPVGQGLSSKTLLGTALGAAAGAALIYAMMRDESKNSKAEADHLAYMSRSKSRHSLDETRRMPPPPPPTIRTQPPSDASEAPPVSVAPDGRRLHRNFSTTESAYSRPPVRTTQALRMIEATGHNSDDDVQEVMSRYTNLRPHPTRSRTADASDYASDYAPAPAPSHTGRSSHSTNPNGLVEYVEATPRSVAPSTHSHASSRHKPHADDTSKSTTSRRSAAPSHRRTSAEETDKLQRHDSGISVISSSRSPRGSEIARKSSASTIRARRDSGQDAAPLPPPPIGAHAPPPPSAPSRTGSSCYYPAAISLPPSAVSTGGRQLHPRDAAGSVAASSTGGGRRRDAQEQDSVVQSWEEFEAEESDGLGDVKTVVPDDSISCVDLSQARRHRGHHHHRSSRHHGGGSRHSHSGRESEVSERTARPPAEKKKERKSSVLGLPVRLKEGSSRFSFA